MHPILVELIPQNAIILGALVALVFGWSHWSAQIPERKTLGRLAIFLTIAAAVGAGLAYVVVTGFFDPKAPPKIHTFGPLVALGSFLSILYIRHEGARRGFDPEILTGLAVEVLLVGVAGSRVLFILITPEAFVHRPEAGALYNWFIQYIALWNGGLVWYGGLLPAAIFALWRGKALGLPWRTIGDIFAPAVMLGLGVGRIGCLMAGDDHGKLVESGAHWWTLTFPVNKDTLVSEELQGKPLWPSQPMMMIGCFIIFSFCHSLQKKLQDRPGAVTLVMLTLYPIHRFFIEMIRGDVIRKFLIPFDYKDVFDPRTGAVEKVAVDGLSTSQAISIPLAAFCLGTLIYLIKRPPRGIEKPGEKAALEAPEPPVGAAPAAPGP